MKKAWLILDSGEVFCGQWHGGQDRYGEVVFNTTHSGYQEVATDPSYSHQIVVMTAPMQGNYGVSDLASESRRLWLEGFVCLQVQNSQRDAAWLQYLTAQGIPVMSGVDTRQITKRLRSGGTTWGALVQAEQELQAREKAAKLLSNKTALPKDWVFEASRKEVEKITGDHMAGPRIAVLDFGAKENILRELKHFSRELIVFSSRATAKQILDFNPDGLMLTNGPGDPSDVEEAQETVRELVGKLPIFGICMGHQILSLALGAKTYKMKFGHRGANHPIQDTLLQRTYVTSQNHGYAVDANSLPASVKITQINLNDNTVAGFYSEKLKVLGIQYHPESCPGPHEARDLFLKFREMML
ncbi:MAG: glutamine-hydrolyzing carbamoyl-phosphate synthase small subunit [Bdellovibrionia bacterium]